MFVAGLGPNAHEQVWADSMCLALRVLVTVYLRFLTWQLVCLTAYINV